MERSVEIIGEAARRVSETFKKVHPEIPWRSIIAQRSVLTHKYGEIDQELRSMTKRLKQTEYIPAK